MNKTMIIAFTLLFAISGIALAQPHKRDNTSVPMFRWWKVASVQEQLNITDDESKKLDKIYQATKTNMIDFKAAAEKKMITLEMEFGQDSFNKDQCLKIFKEAQDIRTNMAMEKFKFVLSTKEILKQERFDQLNEMYKKQRKKQRTQRSMKSNNKQRKGCPQFGQNQPCQFNGEGCQKKFN